MPELSKDPVGLSNSTGPHDDLGEDSNLASTRIDPMCFRYSRDHPCLSTASAV